MKDGMNMIIRRMVDRLPRIVTGASFIATMVNRFDMHSYINDLCVLEPTEAGQWRGNPELGFWC